MSYKMYTEGKLMLTEVSCRVHTSPESNCSDPTYTFSMDVQC